MRFSLIVLFSIALIFCLAIANALSITVISPNGGENWVGGSVHDINVAISNAGLQPDFNSSYLLSLYYSEIAGQRQNLITTINPIFTTINPDANSQDWFWASSGQNHFSYDTTTKIDGAGSAKFGLYESDNPTLYYSQFQKNFTDTNIFDINKNGGHLTFYVKTDCVYCQGYAGTGYNAALITLTKSDGTVIVGGNVTDYGFRADTNNVWKQITYDLNTMGQDLGNLPFTSNLVQGIKIKFYSSNPIPTDFNYWIDGIRIYDNQHCLDFDGNQSDSNVFCTYPWTLPNIQNQFLDANVLDLNTDRNFTVQDSSDSIFNVLDLNSQITVTFFSRDTSTGVSLPNTNITIKKYVGGVLTKIAESQTDVSGAATFNLYYNVDYYIDANYGTLTLTNQLIRPITTQYTIRFNVSASVGTVTPTSTIGIKTTYSPNATTIDYNSDGIIALGTIVQSTNGSNISKVIFTLTQDSNVLYTVTQTNSGIPFSAYIIPIPLIDINSTALTQGKNFDFNVFVQLVDGNIGIDSHTITFVHQAELYDTFNLMQQLPANTDPTFMAFVSLFLTIIIVGFCVYATGNHPSVSIIGGMCLLFFGFLNWLPIGISIIACLGGFAFYYLRSGF